MSDITRILDAAVVRPGDVLVLSCDKSLSEATVLEIRDAIAEEFPDIKTLILGHKIRLHVLRAGEVSE